MLAHEDTPGEKRVIAYVVLRDPDADLRSHLHDTLPDYMIPSAFVVLEALPVTPNGKVDRKTLPAPDFASLSNQASFVAPRTPSEIALADIWAKVLGIRSIRRTRQLLCTRRSFAAGHARRLSNAPDVRR